MLFISNRDCVAITEWNDHVHLPIVDILSRQSRHTSITNGEVLDPLFHSQKVALRIKTILV